ncbi:MAG: NADH-quinone oxidoreductase subunit E [Rhizobiaceae bacterium]|nr:NADH-quinone oxidoreductase subunit E [Rhizobiaceae bacterium]
MSVRRLAEPAVQPAAFAFSGDRAEEVKTWIAKYPAGRQQSAVIPLLMLAQEQEGWVTRAAIESVADMLGMPYIRALEVATFYTQFQLSPVGTKAHIQVCGTTPCMLRGAEDLIDICKSKINPEPFHTNADGTLSWEEVECLGACVNAPMVMIFKDTYEDLTPERLAEIIDEFEAGRGSDVPVGPQNGRMVSSPIDGLTSLRDEKSVLKSTRDKEARAAAKTTTDAPKSDGGESVPPSEAARPKTHAEVTNGALKSPSPVKSSAKAESASSVAAPAHNEAAANKVASEVEQVSKQRKSPKEPNDSSEPAPYVSPKLNQAIPVRDTAKSEQPALDHKDRPASIERPATPDNLQLISGVGPKLESTLHSLGIYTYAQIAGWKKAEREWVDGYLRFKGRIEREDWVKQAKALAKGGVDEYVRVFGKKPV